MNEALTRVANQKDSEQVKTCEISSSHGGEYED
jgi:hypothetical protein